MLKEPLAKTRISLNTQPRHIYALVDPRDNAVRYVGVTNNVYYRLAQHAKETSKGSNKGLWLAELKQHNLTPELEILETIEACENADLIAAQREQYWIHELLRQGFPLVNIAIPSHIRSICMSKFEELRTNAGLTITRLSIEADISRATIEKIEKDLPVRAPLAARACNALSRHLGRQVTYQELNIKTVR